MEIKHILFSQTQFWPLGQQMSFNQAEFAFRFFSFHVAYSNF